MPAPEPTPDTPPTASLAPGGALAAAVPARRYGGRTPDQRCGARRERFLEAGYEVFGRAGLRGATVRGVCTAAGLTDRYFRESFASLEDLLLAVFRRLVHDLGRRLHDEVLSSDAWGEGPEAAARQAARGYALWFRAVRDPRFARIVLVEVPAVGPALDAAYEALLGEFADLILRPLATALPGRVPGASQRRLLGRALVGAALHVGRLWMTDGYRAPRREVVQACVLVATGTLEALRQGAGPTVPDGAP